jgi:hypothetical protein
MPVPTTPASPNSACRAGDMLTFSRPMKLPDGSEVTPSFKLAFAADLRAPDFFGFAVERINVPAADRSALTIIRTAQPGFPK